MKKPEKKRTEQEALLARVLEECLEEDLSFVPPEGEIARSHRFSKSFEEKMAPILEKESKEEKIRKQTAPRYGQLAACVLVFCIASMILWNGKGLLFPEKTANTTEMAESAAPMPEDIEETESAVEETADEGTPLTAEEAAWAAGAVSDQTQEGIFYCGSMVYPAVQQEVPEQLENVTTLVNCPVQNEENTVIYLTIGNIGEETIRYLDGYDLEVQADGIWYVIPQKEESVRTWKELEGKMAVDFEIPLEAYELDHGAQEYRLIAYVNGQQISAEFTFEEVFAEKMEAQEQVEKQEERGENE